MFSTGSAGGSAGDEDRIPVTSRWPVVVPDEAGRPVRFGWFVAAIGETGIDVLHQQTRQLRCLSWDELYTFNPDFNIEAVLAETGDFVAVDEPPAPTPTPPPTVPAPVSPVVPVAAEPPAPVPVAVDEPAPPAPAFRLTVGRSIVMPIGAGADVSETWLVVAVAAEGVTAARPDSDQTYVLTWGQVLMANPDWLPTNTRVRMSSGRNGLFRGVNGTSAVVEGAASYDDTSRGLRSTAFIEQQFMEPFEPFAMRNADRIG